MKKAVSLILALCALLCAGRAVNAEETTVAATFYPIYILAKNVLNGVPDVTLHCMAAPSSGCLHDYQLLPRDMRTLSGASLLLINGAGMESFLPMIREQFPALPVVDLSQGVALLPEAEEPAHHHEDAADGRDGEEAWNPHIWLSPPNAMQMVANMEKALIELLPQDREQIAQNAAQYTARLSALDAELSAALSTLPNRDIVTFHEAFPYFAQRYGLRVAAVVALEPDDPLSPQMLSQVTKTVRQAGNPPLFAEPQYGSAALRVICQETGAKVYALTPLVTGEDSLTAYEDGMRQNLAVLLEALGQNAN